jgi:hypothetical protein
LVGSAICGVLYLAKVFVPLFVWNKTPVSSNDGSWWFWVMVPGSGIALLLALLSFGLERRIASAVISLCVLAVTENVVFAAMPFWTLMLLGGWSAWAALAYIVAFVAAIVLIVRRVITGQAVFSFSLQFSRCPLFAAMKSHPGPR